MIRVAIVEDDAEVQGVLQEYVRRYTRQYGTEFEVTVFADGVDILEDYRAVYDGYYGKQRGKRGSGQSGRKDRGCDRAVFFRGGGYRGGDGIINLGSSETD